MNESKSARESFSGGIRRKKVSILYQLFWLFFAKKTFFSEKKFFDQKKFFSRKSFFVPKKFFRLKTHSYLNTIRDFQLFFSKKTFFSVKTFFVRKNFFSFFEQLEEIWLFSCFSNFGSTRPQRPTQYGSLVFLGLGLEIAEIDLISSRSQNPNHVIRDVFTHPCPVYFFSEFFWFVGPRLGNQLSHLPWLRDPNPKK